MKNKRFILLVAILSFVGFLAGCGSSGGGSNPTNPITVSITLPSSSMKVSTMQTLTAVVGNDSTNAGVTWSCTPSGSCGSFNPTTSAGSTATTAYTAPSAATTVTVTATSVTDPTKSANADIKITTTPPPVAVTLSPTPITMPTGGKAAFSALVSNDSQNKGVTWTATCGGTACGALSASSTGSGVATDFTASSIAAGATLTITATSVADTSASASATINVTNLATNLADGTYVFSAAGEDNVAVSGSNCAGVLNVACSPYYVAGAFKVSGGAIVGGEQDFIDLGTIDTQDPITGGSILTGFDATGNLLINLITTNLGTETFNAKMVSATRALIIEYDNGATSSGTLDLQGTTVAPLSGGYAFSLAGLDGSGSSLPVGLGGVINVDGSGSISGNGSVFDINDAGSLGQGQTFNASTVTAAPDGFGRVVFNMVPSSSSIPTISMVGYIVGPNHIRLVETTDNFNGTTGGVALGQGSSTGTFSSASIAGTSFVFGTIGADPNGGFMVAGELTTNSGGTVSGFLNANDLSISGVQAPIGFAGTYTVDPTGRVTLSSLTGGGLTITAQFYLSGLSTATNVSGDGIATVLTMDASDVLSGLAYQQTGGGLFTATSFFGNYGMNATGFDFANENEFDAVGPALADGVNALSATVDLNFIVPPATPTANVAVTPASFTANANGEFFTGTITGLDIDTPGNADNFAYYMIDTTKAIAIQTDSNQMTQIRFELQQ